MPLDLKNYIKRKIKTKNVDLKPSRPGDDQNPLLLIKSTTQTLCKAWPTGQAVPHLHSTVTINYIPKRHMGACCAQFTPKGPHLAIPSLLKVTKASSTCKRFAVSHSSEKTISPIKTTLSWCHTSHWQTLEFSHPRLRDLNHAKKRKEKLLKICFSQEQFRKGLRGAGGNAKPWHAPVNSSSWKLPKYSRINWLDSYYSKFQPKPAFLPPLLLFAVIRRAKGKKKAIFFYMLVKYNLLNVLCQCIKLPTMLIEYLIDIYLLTSYLC